MKKVQLFIIILVVIILFSAGDYFVNMPGGLNTADTTASQAGATSQVEDSYPNLIQELLDLNNEFQYTIIKRDRSKQIFEQFDLSTLSNVAIYMNTLKGTGVKESSSPIVIYEIHGKKNQGALTYQNLKLKIVDQMARSGIVNEVTDYGYNSFFYNDPKNENSGYLVSQIEDNIFGFQYSKADKNNFTTIKSMINALMEMDLLI